jgi:DNA polymerase-3 subunit gamma/tau
MCGIAENNPAEALAIVDDVVMRGHNLRNFLRDVLAHLRDLLVVKVSGDPKILDSASTHASVLKEQADQFSESDLVRFFHSLAETESTLKEAANPRYQVEVGLVKLMEMRRLAPLGDLIDRIATLESALRTGKAPAEGLSPRTATAKSPPTHTANLSPGSADTAPLAEESSPTASSAGALKTESTFCDSVKAKLKQKRRPLLVAALEGALRAELTGDEFVIEFRPENKHYRDTLARGDNAKSLREACAEACGREVGIRYLIKSEGQATTSTADVPDNREAKQKARRAAAADPTVQQVLRTFGGEIVDVKSQ